MSKQLEQCKTRQHSATGLPSKYRKVQKCREHNCNFNVQSRCWECVLSVLSLSVERSDVLLKGKRCIVWQQGPEYFSSPCQMVGEECIRGVRVIYNNYGFADIACDVNVHNGERH